MDSPSIAHRFEAKLSASTGGRLTEWVETNRFGWFKLNAALSQKDPI
jgi:hypothetical protein